MLLFGVQGQKSLFSFSFTHSFAENHTQIGPVDVNPIKSLHEALQRIKATAVEKLEN